MRNAFLRSIIEQIPKGELPIRADGVKRRKDFIPGPGRQPPSVAPFLHRLMGKLFRGSRDQIVIREFEFRHQYVQRLDPEGDSPFSLLRGTVSFIFMVHDGN